ncbi:uncharacterized protein METZ01_LOCUS121823 [marine metagenome]|uniref:Uncharacterized protein n=1 Tax=marine metagenome TaxID=408172 RepID=A0A381XW09_9ZZZZ
MVIFETSLLNHQASRSWGFFVFGSGFVFYCVIVCKLCPIGEMIRN